MDPRVKLKVTTEDNEDIKKVSGETFLEEPQKAGSMVWYFGYFILKLNP